MGGGKVFFARFTARFGKVWAGRLAPNGVKPYIGSFLHIRIKVEFGRSPPICRCSKPLAPWELAKCTMAAIALIVSVVSRRSHAAITNLSGSFLPRSYRSRSAQPNRLNSSATNRYSPLQAEARAEAEKEAALSRNLIRSQRSRNKESTLARLPFKPPTRSAFHNPRQRCRKNTNGSRRR